MALDKVADQVKADEKLRNALTLLSSKLDEKYRAYIYAVYTDPFIHSYYEGLRNESAFSKKKTHRMIVRIPNGIIHQFLDDLFSPYYGKDWLSDKQTLLKVCKREELIWPWLTVKKL